MTDALDPAPGFQGSGDVALATDLVVRSSRWGWARGAPRGRPSVCFYTPSVDPSGMGAHMLDLVRVYAGDTDVSLMCRPTEPGRGLLAAAERLGAVPVPLPCPRDPGFEPTITRFLQDRPADVFHCHVGIGWEGWGGVRAARRAGVQAVLQTQHLPFALTHPHKRRALLRVLAEVDHVIAVSDGVRRTYERIGLPEGRITTVRNGVHPRPAGYGRAVARRRLGLPAHSPVVLTVGRLTHMKGQHRLVEAVPDLLRRFPQLAVVLVGQGPLRGALVRRADELGVRHAVHFAGHRPDARALLDAADVFVLPSRHEGMPLAVIEAMDAGLPVVATDVVGAQELVVDGRTGLLVPPDDSPALAAALGSLLAAPGLAAALGRTGRLRYLRRFTANRMAAETSAVYLRVLGAPVAATLS